MLLMIKPDIPLDENERIAALKRYRILDTLAEDAYDDLLNILAGICGAPMGAVTLVDEDRQWFKAKLGLQVSQTPRKDSFCAHAILRPSELMVVEDAARDPRFFDNPLVTGETNIRFYAGAPLTSSDGYALGALCVMDHEPRQLSAFQKSALSALSRQASALMELRRSMQELRHQLGEREWYEQRLQEHRDALELQNAQLIAQTRADPLTGLANRRAFNVQLDAELARSKALGSPLALAMCDIDHFKKINDTYGHPAGDQVLIELALMLQQALGEGAMAARCGGEEFALLLPQFDMANASALCESIRLTTPTLPVMTPVTLSLGLAMARADDTPENLYKRADKLLYAAKESGRNRLVLDS